MALSQVPTCKFSTANIHKNICDVFISTCLEQYIHIVVDDAIVILHINKVCRHSCHHVKKKPIKIPEFQMRLRSTAVFLNH